MATEKKFREISQKVDELFAASREDEGRKLLESAIADAKNNDAYRLFFEGELAHYAGDNETTREKNAQAVALKPHDHFLLKNYGVVLSFLGRNKEAIALFDQALKIKPDDYLSLQQKGISLSKLDRDEEAIPLFDQALEIKPDDYHSLQQKGVSLSKLDRDEEAIALFDQALEIKPDDYLSLQQKGVSLSKLGRDEEAIPLFDLALEIKPDDYHSLRQKGVSLSKLDRNEEAILLFDQALEIKPDDYDSLRQKGVSLSTLGRDEEAIALFDQALEIKPDDYHSLQQKGVSLSKLDRDEEAIPLFDQALEIKPNDYDSLRQKGVSLSKLGRDEEAIVFIDQALKIKPDDYRSLRQKSVSLFNMGNIAKAYKLIRQALEKNPSSEQLQKDASFVFSQLNDEDKAKLGETTDNPDSTNIGGLRGFIQTVREEFKNAITDFERKKEKNEHHLREFISADSKLAADSSVFLVLRKWNSFTPALPLDGGEKSVGGGYFIHHLGKGTVIDPGYNFIENFHKAGCRLLDIDNIVITHAHNDHTIDFESILTLLYQANKEKKLSRKRVTLYLNQGAMLKFASLIDWRTRIFIGEIFTINPGDTYRMSDNSTVMTVLPAYHDEIVTKYYAVGLHFAFSFGKADKRSLLLTSDTGLYPPSEKGESDQNQQSSKMEIHERYKLISGDLVRDVDILVPHLGSIGKKELSAVEDMNWQPEDILYENHLGVLGVLRIISAIKPKLALVSEFGEELKTFREDLLRLMQKVMEKVMPVDSINILPADLPFIYNIRERTVFCVDTEEMTETADIKFEEEDGTFYYYCDDAKRKKFKNLKERFENTTQRPYLKKDAMR